MVLRYTIQYESGAAGIRPGQELASGEADNAHDVARKIENEFDRSEVTGYTEDLHPIIEDKLRAGRVASLHLDTKPAVHVLVEQP